MGLLIEAISDLHGDRPRLLPEFIGDAETTRKADVLVVAGDVQTYGLPNEFEPYISWMGAQYHKHKIFVPGNHDKVVESNTALIKMRLAEVGVQLLVDEGTEIEGIRFYGYPHTPPFFKWAYMPKDARRQIY